MGRPVYPGKNIQGQVLLTALEQSVLYARSCQLALGFIESHLLTAYMMGLLVDTNINGGKNDRGISPTALGLFGTCPFKFLWEKVLRWSHWKNPKD